MRHLSLVLIGLGLAGCHAFGGSSGGAGAGGSLYFANCGEGCTLPDHPVAAGGAHTTINVTNLGFASVRSSDPTVATFSRNGQSIEVISGAPGTTELELLDAQGGLVTQATLTVEATALLRVDHGWTGATPLILEGQPLAFHVTTLDAHGRTTKGSGAVSFALDGSLAPTIVPVNGDAIGFVGSAGAGHVTASCPDTSVTQSFTVVPASAITALTTSSQTLANDSAIVSVVPESAAGAVYGGPCVWKSSDPSVTLASDVGPALDLGPGTVSVFNLTRAGSFTVSCTLAGRTAMVTVSR